MDRLTDHLIILSFDCLSALDLPILKELPHFQTILANGALVEQVESIYPSVTYPCHATIVTGNYPKHHGVINNTLLQPGMASPDWNWYRKCIRGTTLYDEVKKANMTTAALLWPVTAGADIDFNMPEIFANRPWKNQIVVSLMNGSPLFQWEMNKRYGHIRKGLKQPELDDFVLESAVDTIKKRMPNLLMVHFTDLDTQRHDYGFSSQDAIAALHRHNSRLGRILKALEEAGIHQQSTVIALGDHSALDEQKAISLNVLLHKQNLLTTNTKGKLIDWKAYCKSCDGSAYIYLKDPGDQKTLQIVHKLLDLMLDEPDFGIEKFITGEKAAALGADPACDFMIEARRGFYFLEDYTGEVIKTITKGEARADKKYTLACHGYSPEKENYGTILMAAGKGIQQVTLPSIRLIDEGPTFARLLGVSLGTTDGKMIEELLTSKGEVT